MTIDLTLNIGDLLAVFVALLAFIGAVYIGIQQNNINKKMLSLQDAVDVYLAIGAYQATFEQETIYAPVIMIHNISTLPIALCGYTFNGIERKIPAYRLPPASQFPNAHYYVYLPIKDIDYVSFVLELEDSFKRKWKVNGFAEIKNGKWEISSDTPENKG
ncbi:MAG: hypothetical protein IJB55_03470 [Firmicutes bacterium]|nr:hypothetical protein [Bacillota bacterium]